MYRHELKFLITDVDRIELRNVLQHVCRHDPHAQDGFYSISSLYFDGMYQTAYQEKLDGVEVRKKYRIRIYNNSAERITLENKKKICGMTQKDACSISKELCDGILSGKIASLESGKEPVWNRFAEAYNTKLLRPKVIVDYERTVFVCTQGNVRITFDRNISSSVDYDHFFEGNMAKRPIMPTGIHVLEVKYDEFLPDYIYKSAELESLNRTTYSKYYLCRKYSNI